MKAEGRLDKENSTRARKTGKKERMKWLSGEEEGGGLFSEAPPLFWLLSMKETTVWGNLHKHASLLPPPLFMINEIRVAFAHRLKYVIADNCLSFPKLEVALFDVCFYVDLLKVMKLLFLYMVERT